LDDEIDNKEIDKELEHLNRLVRDASGSTEIRKSDLDRVIRMTERVLDTLKAIRYRGRINADYRSKEKLFGIF
jgi:hypothetical protein